MNLFVCIDDTDNLDSIGTGALLENMMQEAALQGLGRSGFIVRYQLFIHEDIPYTSHNSSMCCTVETNDRDAFTAFCADYLQSNAAEGSDPGLCVLTDDGALDYTPLVAFGKRAQTEVVTKSDAYAAANAFGNDVRLSEHGGTGGGVIGALAGAALRAGKEEGKIKGKLQPLQNKADWTMADFSAAYGVERFADEDGKEIAEDVTIRYLLPTKLMFQSGKVTAILVQKDRIWMPKPKVKKNKG
ncbi:MAG: hypothetical protein IJL52_05915 [Clostridia bacterium]|nr:hypothetical protein [Clostridia bacterium]